VSIPYLKVKPEKAISVLEEYIVKGYRLMTPVNNEYFGMKERKEWGDNSSTLEAIQKWRMWLSDWTNECESNLFEIFVSAREVYNFGDAKPPFGVTSEDVRFTSVLDQLRAKITCLNKYTEFIFEQFNVKFSVKAGRDAVVQTGNNPVSEIKNG
jgi:hypothetical protein